MRKPGFSVADIGLLDPRQFRSSPHTIVGKTFLSGNIVPGIPTFELVSRPPLSQAHRLLLLQVRYLITFAQ